MHRGMHRRGQRRRQGAGSRGSREEAGARPEDGRREGGGARAAEGAAAQGCALQTHALICKPTWLLWCALFQLESSRTGISDE